MTNMAIPTDKTHVHVVKPFLLIINMQSVFHPSSTYKLLKKTKTQTTNGHPSIRTFVYTAIFSEVK